MTKNILIYIIGIAAIVCTTKPNEEKSDILYSNLDTTVSPYDSLKLMKLPSGLLQQTRFSRKLETSGRVGWILSKLRIANCSPFFLF